MSTAAAEDEEDDYLCMNYHIDVDCALGRNGRVYVRLPSLNFPILGICLAHRQFAPLTAAPNVSVDRSASRDRPISN